MTAINQHVEIIARAVIVSGDKLLACQTKGTDWYFLPGGHIDFGEPAEKALLREIKEETGLLATVNTFLGVVENLYTEDRKKHHEINLLFSVQANTTQFTSREGHIRFSLIDVAQLSKVKLLPLQLKHALLVWFSDHKPFWVGGAINDKENS